MQNKRVAILYRYIPQYRLEVYRRLYELCRENSIDLDVIYGNPAQSDSIKHDAVDFEYGIFKRNRFLTIGRVELIWQPVLAETSE
jgi:hypothetical protein